MKQLNNFKPILPKVEGYLEKLTNSHFDAWSRGYYVLNAEMNTIECYSREDKKKLVGSENLENIKGVRATFDERR